MKNNHKYNRRAVKTQKSPVSLFFRALVVGFAVVVALLVVLSAIFALVLSKTDDGGSYVSLASPVVTVISLAAGGFVSGKLDGADAVFSALILGAATLGLSYAVSTALDLSANLGPILKTVHIGMVMFSPFFGAKLASGRAKTKNGRRL